MKLRSSKNIYYFCIILKARYISKIVFLLDCLIYCYKLISEIHVHVALAHLVIMLKQKKSCTYSQAFFLCMILVEID